MKLEDINPDEVDEINSIKIDRRKSSNEIILYREFDSNCGQHFILRNDKKYLSLHI